MKIIALLIPLCMLSGGAIGAPATRKPAAWWGHSSSHHHGKAVRPHTGRRNLSTHPERRRRMNDGSAAARQVDKPAALHPQ